MESNSIRGVNDVRKYIVGFLLGVALAFSLSASAEDVKSFIGAKIEGQFPVTVNGDAIEIPGIVIGGKSYLPTRTIAELAGYEVTFDADLGIELTKIKRVEGVEQLQEGVQTPVIDPVKEKLKSVEAQIPAAMTNITVIEGFLLADPNNEAWQTNLQKAKDLLSELQSEKASLEAQLQEGQE